MNGHYEQCFPGVWRITLGTPDQLTPHFFFGGRESSRLSEKSEQPLPWPEEKIRWENRKNGFLVTLPLSAGERLYGLGLQFGSYLQNGRRKTLRANADAPKDTGDSHAPVPFYVSTAGYGVLADTAKNVTFDCGAVKKADTVSRLPSAGKGAAATTEELYQEELRSQEVNIFVPGAQGLTLYLFADETMRGVVERYNLFSGGGAMPPAWGLGALYRCYTHASQDQAESLIRELAEENIPVSMIGLEPGWHSQAYSCSFRWSLERYPNPDHLIQLAEEKGMNLNLWEQCYVHPTSDIYEQMQAHAGDFEVWNGLVPDYGDPEARKIYSEMQGRLIDQGVRGFKLDECDGSDYTGGWFYPEFSQFPSGLTGEEMKNMFGALGQRAVNQAFADRGLRTFSEVRANWSYAAPMGFVLYSDLYDHRQFIRAVSNASFCGLLWSPEVRQCGSAAELIRRMQSAALSPMMVINSWMIPSPPWKQYDIEKNLAGELLPDSQLEDQCRELIRLRNRFFPYLYAAFAKYAREGTPPFRAMALDYPDDPAFAEADDCYFMGDSLLVAPILNEGTKREVPLPPGVWYDFWTEQPIQGGRTITAETHQIPLYVRQGTALALGGGEPVHGGDVIPLEIRLYGTRSGDVLLIEDDRETLNYQQGEQRWTTLSLRDGKALPQTLEGYSVDSVRVIL